MKKMTEHKVVNFCASRFREIFNNWAPIYIQVMEAFHKCGYQVHVSPHLNFDQELPSYVKVGITDDVNHVYVYNHRNIATIKEEGYIVSNRLNLFIKPTGPTQRHFTLDPLGYAAASSITYECPGFMHVDSSGFFNTLVKQIKEMKMTKWTDDGRADQDQIEVDIPADHTLIIAQTDGDETNTLMSFGQHWVKIKQVVNKLLLNDQPHPIVLKMHPAYSNDANKSYYDDQILPHLLEWREAGVLVLEGNSSLHDVLPHTRVAILENSTSGIECMLYDVPIICFGYPEYHWAACDMRHITWLNDYVNDLSWHEQGISRSWLTWYCTQYQCYDQDSTTERVKQLLAQSV